MIITGEVRGKLNGKPPEREKKEERLLPKKQAEGCWSGGGWGHGAVGEEHIGGHAMG